MTTLNIIAAILFLAALMFNCHNLIKQFKKLRKVTKLHNKIMKLFEVEKSIYQVRQVLRKLEIYEPDDTLDMIEISIVQSRYRGMRKAIEDELKTL